MLCDRQTISGARQVIQRPGRSRPRPLGLVSGMVLVLAMSASSAESADAVRRRSSNRQDVGTVERVSRESVVIRTQTGLVTIAAGDVDSITYENQPPQVNVGLVAERRGNLDAALEQYRQAEAASATEAVKEDVEYYIARTLAQQAAGDELKAAEAIQRLQEFLKKRPQSRHYYPAHEWLGDLQLAVGRPEEAQRAFQTLGEHAWPEFRQRSRLGEARVQMRQERFDAALAVIDALLKEPTDSLDESSRHDAVLTKAQCLSRQGAVAEADKLLRDVIKAAPDDSAGLLARAHTTLGDCLYADRKPQEQNAKAALLAYLHVDVLPDLANQRQEHAKALYYLSKLWAQVGDADRAQDAQARLKQRYANSAWAKRP